MCSTHYLKPITLGPCLIFQKSLSLQPDRQAEVTCVIACPGYLSDVKCVNMHSDT